VVPGGAAIIATVSGRWQAVTGGFIREGYWLSETSPLVSFNPMNVEKFTGTTGLPVPSTHVKLLNNGIEVAPGESGEICVRGPQVIVGYWNQPEATR
jgi:long-chain acyl-CoA synthetase